MNFKIVIIQDADGRPDQLVADESWENHTRLNKSIIVDLFQGIEDFTENFLIDFLGQFKATIKCLSCKFTSVKFDAFMFLSLPIPTSGKATLEGCLNLFQQTEKLTGEDRWTCPKVTFSGLIDGASSFDGKTTGLLTFYLSVRGQEMRREHFGCGECRLFLLFI